MCKGVLPIPRITSIRLTLSLFNIFLLKITAFPQLQSVEPLKIKLEKHTQNDTIKVNLLNELSYQDQWYNFYSSLNYAEKALELAHQLSFKKGIAVARYRIAHCYWALGDSELSIDQALQAAYIAEKEKLPDVLAETYRILAMNYRDQQETAEAEIYLQKAEKIAHQTKNWDLLSRVYNFSGVMQYTRNENELALASYHKALAIAQRHPIAQFHISQVYSNIGEVYSDQRKNNPKLESFFFNKALSIAKKTRNRSAQAAILNNIGKVLIREKRYPEASKYLNESLDLARELNVKRIIKNIYLSFIDLKVQQGKSREAQEYMEKYYAVRDSLLNEKKTRQIVKMETRFEAEKKEQKIKLLLQESQIQNLWINIWIVGSLLLLAAVGIIYRLQQLRARKIRQMLEIQTELNNKLNETDQLKSRFFANISHEFRTPLSLILAPVEEMIASSSLFLSHKTNLHLVKRNANRLLDLVNQLLDLSKLDAGKMGLKMQNEGLMQFLNILTSSFDSLAEIRQIHFRKSINLPSTEMWYDKDKLEKIIGNLLSNAFKFTDMGGAVSFSVSPANKGATLLIQISDTGKGIAEEDLSHVFSPFFQSRLIAADGLAGTGLGLTLVSELVKLHKGKIEITSKLNAGTSISIILPVTKADLEFEEVQSNQDIRIERYKDSLRTIARSDEPQTHGVYATSILVVEDNLDLRNFIVSCFGDDFRIIQAGDGEQGLELAIENLPDLIISDVMMPKMDGINMTEKIKKDERTSHIPVILLTAKIDTESRIDGFRHGADDYLAKPFVTEELKIRVENLIELRKKLAAKYRKNLLAPAELPRMPSAEEKFVFSLRAAIEGHLSDSDFTVEQLAEEMCLSRTQLFRKVKALLDMSPSEMMNDIRLQRAADLIHAKTDTVTQISYSVGFNEQSYFAKRFRKKFGVSPSEYSKSSPTQQLRF